MALTVAQAQGHLDDWLAADTAVAQGRSYSIGDRTLTRESADEIRKSIANWQRVVDSLTSQAAGGKSAAALATWT